MAGAAEWDTTGATELETEYQGRGEGKCLAKGTNFKLP